VKATVLLVDDDPNVLDALRRSLRHESYAIHGAANAAEALAFVGHRDVAAIVSDESMPGMRGAALLERVRRMSPDTVRIILTGHRDFDAAMRAINLGEVDRFFVKPCDTAELKRALRQLIAERALQHHSRRLLGTVRSQARILESLEQDTPWITAIERTRDGSIVIDDSPVDLESLLAEIEDEIERAACRSAD